MADTPRPATPSRRTPAGVPAVQLRPLEPLAPTPQAGRRRRDAAHWWLGRLAAGAARGGNAVNGRPGIGERR